MLRYMLSKYSGYFKDATIVNPNKVNKYSFHTPLGRWSINEPDHFKYIKADMATHDSCGGIQCNYPIMPKDRMKPAKRIRPSTLEKSLNDRLALYVGEQAYKK